MQVDTKLINLKLWGDITMKKMIAYCGLDCEKCDAYIATINDNQELRKKTAKLWAELNLSLIHISEPTRRS